MIDWILGTPGAAVFAGSLIISLTIFGVGLAILSLRISYWWPLIILVSFPIGSSVFAYKHWPLARRFVLIGIIFLVLSVAMFGIRAWLSASADMPTRCITRHDFDQYKNRVNGVFDALVTKVDRIGSKVDSLDAATRELCEHQNIKTGGCLAFK